jgi:hypothetical protein
MLDESRPTSSVGRDRNEEWSLSILRDALALVAVARRIAGLRTWSSVQTT